MKELCKLDFDTQKDQIIARLILQKSLIYVQTTEKWLEDFLTKRECELVIKYASENDKKAFHFTYNEIVETFEVLI